MDRSMRRALQIYNQEKRNNNSRSGCLSNLYYDYSLFKGKWSKFKDLNKIVALVRKNKNNTVLLAYGNVVVYNYIDNLIV